MVNNVIPLLDIEVGYGEGWWMGLGALALIGSALGLTIRSLQTSIGMIIPRQRGNKKKPGSHRKNKQFNRKKMEIEEGRSQGSVNVGMAIVAWSLSMTAFIYKTTSVTSQTSRNLENITRSLEVEIDKIKVDRKIIMEDVRNGCLKTLPILNIPSAFIKVKKTKLLKEIRDTWGNISKIIEPIENDTKIIMELARFKLIRVKQLATKLLEGYRITIKTMQIIVVCMRSVKDKGEKRQEKNKIITMIDGSMMCIITAIIDIIIGKIYRDVWNILDSKVLEIRKEEQMISILEEVSDIIIMIIGVGGRVSNED